MVTDLRQSFTAHGEIFNGELTLPVTITGSIPRNGMETVHCTVIIDPSDSQANLLPQLLVAENTFQLRGTTALGEQLFIPAFRTYKATSINYPYRRFSYEDDVELFIIGQLDTFEPNGARLTCSLSIPFTKPLASPDQHIQFVDSGAIALATPELLGLLGRVASPQEGEEQLPLTTIRRKPEGIRWRTPLGPAELVTRYDFVDDEGDDFEPMLRRITRHEITIDIERSGATSLGTLLAELPTALDEALWLLSLISHRRILWHTATIGFRPDHKTAAQSRSALARRRVSAWSHSLGHDSLLVRPRSLREGLFETLCEKLAISPYRELIRQTIPYLLITYERGGGYVEPRLAVCYSALEGLVDRLGDLHNITTILVKSDAKRLAKELRQVIRNAVPEEEAAKEVIGKLGELERRAFVPRLEWLLDYYNVDAAKLWPAGTNMAAEWRGWVQRRNAFVHKGKTLDDDPSYLSDFDRLRYLIELWLLKLLDCPDAALNFGDLGTYGRLTR